MRGSRGVLGGLLLLLLAAAGVAADLPQAFVAGGEAPGEGDLSEILSGPHPVDGLPSASLREDSTSGIAIHAADGGGLSSAAGPRPPPAA